jgi:hypothetical protein
MATIQDSPCPGCGARGTLHISDQYAAQPVTTSSLAGVQVKITAQRRPVLTCSACPLMLVGSYDHDGRHVSFPRPS